MRLLQTALLLTLTSLLTACQTTYQPVEDETSFPHGGYRESYVNGNTIIVSFTGNGFTPQKTIEAFLMYRCARVTVEHGYDYFVVTSTSSSAFNVDLKTRQVVQAVNNPPRLYNSYAETTRYRGFRPATTDMPPYIATVETQDPYPHSAVAVIQMFTGRIPPKLPNAFNANDVIAHLGTTAFRD